METIIQKIKASENGSEAIKRQVCEVLQIDEEKYCAKQYEEGLSFLEHYIPQDKEGQELLFRSRIYWNWWRNHWEIRDIAFLRETEKKAPVSLSKRMQVYRWIHNGSMLTKAIHPGSIVLDESYAEMMGRLIDKNVHHG